MGCSLNLPLFSAKPRMPNPGPSSSPAAGQNLEAQRQKQKEAIRRHDDEVESHVIAHENAHAAIAGNAPVYEYNERGRIVGGHVPVTLNPNSRASLEKAKAAAEAPGGDMSSQDAAVAAQADAMLRALDMKANQGRAQLAMQNPARRSPCQ